MPTVRPKAVSRLSTLRSSATEDGRLATAVQETPGFADIHWEMVLMRKAENIGFKKRDAPIHGRPRLAA
jgi:hypothetical protein